MPIDKLLTEKEAAERLGISPDTLRTWRSRPTANSIPFIKLGEKTVRYSESALKKYIERNTQK